MAKNQDKKNITIDGTEYALDNLSENAKSQLASLRFVDSQIQQLKNEWAIADTARIGYTRAFKRELSKVKGK